MYVLVVSLMYWIAISHVFYDGVSRPAQSSENLNNYESSAKRFQHQTTF